MPVAGPPPLLAAAIPNLYVADVEASCAHFRDALGFTVELTWGQPPFYAQVRRDAARIALRRVCEPVYVGDVRARETLLAASIPLADPATLARLHDELAGRGATIHQPPRDEPWGARTFIVRDVDGNLLLFASPAAG